MNTDEIEKESSSDFQKYNRNNNATENALKDRTINPMSFNEFKSPELLYEGGFGYQLGKGVDKDEKKAFELVKYLAEKEYDLDAQFKLGYYYDKGIGTEINKSRALELYEIAAKKNHKMAQNNLGLLYEKGEEVEKDLEKAFYWFNRAESNDDKLIEDMTEGIYIIFKDQNCSFVL
jgi:hypothetical protein